MNFDSFPSMQLLIGKLDAAHAHIYKQITSRVCARGGCDYCKECNAIKKKNHHALQIIAPQKNNYSLEEIDAVFNQAWYIRDDTEPYFFIIEQADLLNKASANSLLKLFEEPPHGYYFILVAQRIELILPTIISRAVITVLKDEQTAYQNRVESPDALWLDFIELYVHPQHFRLQDWNIIFDKHAISEYETRMILDIITRSWNDSYTQKIMEKTDCNYESIFKIFKRAYLCLPMPGSVKIFWRSLFMQLRLIQLS